MKKKPCKHENRTDFEKVLATLRENKVMVVTKDDGIYIRLAGNEGLGEAFSETFVNAYLFKKLTEFNILENLEVVEKRFDEILKEKYGENADEIKKLHDDMLYWNIAISKKDKDGNFKRVNQREVVANQNIFNAEKYFK